MLRLIISLLFIYLNHLNICIYILLYFLDIFKV